MSFWTRNTRAGSLALCLVIAGAGLSLNCGSCDDTGGGDLALDGGGFGDGESDATGGPQTNNSYDEQTGVGYLTVDEREQKTDLLWVIDNSGSLCEEQRALRNNFARFATRLANQGVDFNMSVTTTQMDDYPLEPVAEPGHIQSEPQPLPSPLIFCRGDEGEPDDPMDGYIPIRDTIATAVGCTKDPEAWQHLLEVTDDEIACGLDPSAGDECGRPERLFPTAGSDGTSPYRQIPKVIRSTEYDAVNKVDIERLSKDFACMAMVGTRGHAVEKGLGAAVAAVSPELTGGTVENPSDASAPNHGLLREDADFGLIFLTDENDCTHDGTLNYDTMCGSDICAFANHPDFADSPLLDPSSLADDFVANLSASKGREMSRDDVTIASLHGRYKRYGEGEFYPEGDAPMSLDACDEMTEIPADDISQKTSCESAAGSAYSGDRYERFARNFSRTYPRVEANGHMPGLICQPDRIPEALEAIGETSSPVSSRCITRDLYACGDGGSAASCPAHRFGDGQPACVQDAQERAICDSAIELQLFAPADSDTPSADLEATGYCVADSIGADGLDRGCVVDRARYDLRPCASGGVRYEWNDDRFFEDLSGFEARVRYLTDAYTAQ